jgi:hypothetical protein
VYCGMSRTTTTNSHDPTINPKRSIGIPKRCAIAMIPGRFGGSPGAAVIRGRDILADVPGCLLLRTGTFKIDPPVVEYLLEHFFRVELFYGELGVDFVILQ